MLTTANLFRQSTNKFQASCICSFIESFISKCSSLSFICLFFHSFAHAFTHLFVHSCIFSFIKSFNYSTVDLFAYSVHPFIHSYYYSFILLFTDPLIHLSITFFAIQVSASTSIKFFIVIFGFIRMKSLFLYKLFLCILRRSKTFQVKPGP